jgi:Tol biopolymer transport system component
VDLDGSNQHRLTDGTGEFLTDISPDGRTLLLTRPDSPGVLWRMGIDGGEPEKLFHDHAGHAEFSPDGRFLLSRARREVDGRTRNFYRIFPAEGGEPVATFLPPGSAFLFEWLPDGSGLVYSHWENGVSNIWLQPSDGGDASQLTRFTQAPIGDIVVSPDGTRLAMNRLLDGVGTLWTVRVDGSDPQKHTEFTTGLLYEVEWSRDSKNVILIQGEERREVVLLTDAGQ